MRTPKSPPELGPSGGALWRRVVRDFELRDDELELLKRAGLALDRADAARAAVARDGAYIPGRFGTKAHPGLSAERSDVLIFARMMRQLGLSDAVPTSERSRPRLVG